jgi:hypothetical protein
MSIWPSTQIVKTANTTTDLSSGTIYRVFQADQDDYVAKLVATPIGANVLSVMRVWLNNGKNTENASNNRLIKEATLPITVAASQVAAAVAVDIVIEQHIFVGQRLYVTTGTVLANGYVVDVVVSLPP